MKRSRPMRIKAQATAKDQRGATPFFRRCIDAASFSTSVRRTSLTRRSSICRACWSLLHPWIVRRVGVNGRATVIDGFRAQFVVPGFVAVDLA